MAARIYALAKELNIDSKILVELCQKAGVTGKGSALASLTDEEVVKVKAYVAGGGAKAARADAPVRPEPVKAGAGVTPNVTVGVPVQVPVAVTKGPVPVMAPPPRPSRVPVGRATPPLQVRPGLDSPPVDEGSPAGVPDLAEPDMDLVPAVAAQEVPAPVAPAVEEPAIAAVAPVAPDAPVKKPAVKPAAPVGPVEPSPMRREDYMAPGGTSGKPMVQSRPLDRRRPTAEGQRPPVQRSGPSIRLGQMPTASQPKAPPKSDEPAPQKPDIRLPADAIRASRAGGGKPLQEHLRKHEAAKRTADAAPAKPGGPAKGKVPPRGPAIPETPEDLAARLARERSRRGKAPVPGVGEDKTAAGLGGREARQLNRKRVGGGKRRPGDEEGGGYRRPRVRMKRVGTNTAAPRKGKVVMEFPTNVRGFSEGLGVPVAKVLARLLAMGTMSNINTPISVETGEFLAMELGIEMDIKQPLNLEDQLAQSVAEADDDQSDAETRAPIVTFLGHVDHGKTSLLDHIIGINVVSGESGGITQHIRAYRIEKDGRAIAFVDTPGHEAFTEMRARGANVTDIAVLVVAADDGVMPQTEEAISHARAAGVPIVVALNKMDLPGINLDKIYQQLATAELLPTEWGGDTEVVKCSAMTGLGMDELLETLLTIADLHDYKASTTQKARGTCLEAELHEGRGVVAKLMVQSGTLKLGDVIVCGAAHGRVKAMYDTLKPSKTYREAGPSTPVNVTGLDVAPGAGDHFYVLDDIAQARDLAAQRSATSRQVTLGGISSHVTLENLHERLGHEEVQLLNLILRADVRGSIEAILKELTKLDHPEVQIKILQATVGGISEADVQLADASDAVIIGFNVVPDEGARNLAEQRGVQVRRYDIIYQVTTDLRAALEGMLKPEKREVELGRALVKKTFTISRLGTIAGCQVLVGTIERNCRMRVIRDSRVIGDYGLDSLKREKDDAREVRVGFECGLRLAGFNDLKEGDILEGYRVEEVARTF